MRLLSGDLFGQRVGAAICFAVAALANRGLLLNAQLAPHALACGLIALGIGVFIASYKWASCSAA